MTSSPPLRLLLCDTSVRLVEAWRRVFDGFADIQVHHGSISDIETDAVVSPANSFGFMDGGIDAFYVDLFGPQVQDRLRQAILFQHQGELLVGAAAIVETGSPRCPYLIAAPTMRVPMVLPADSISPFLATRAVLLLALIGNFSHGGLPAAPIHEHVKTIAFPGMGTGIGRVQPEICARQMREAVENVLHHPFGLPRSWAEASEQHQRLYTERPVRLQY